MRLWDPVTATRVDDLPASYSSVSAVAFGVLPGGRVVLAGGCEIGTVRLWDPVTATLLGDLHTSHTGSVYTLAFGTLSDAKVVLATGSDVDAFARLWDPVTGDPIGDPLTHSDVVSAVAFGVLPSGRVLLATSGFDGMVQLWDPGNLAAGALHTYRTAPSVPWALCFEQTTIYVGCDDGIIALNITDDIAAPKRPYRRSPR